MITQPSLAPLIDSTLVARLFCCAHKKPERLQKEILRVFFLLSFDSCLFLKMGTKRLNEVKESSCDIKDCEGSELKVR